MISSDSREAAARICRTLPENAWAGAYEAWLRQNGSGVGCFYTPAPLAHKAADQVWRGFAVARHLPLSGKDLTAAEREDWRRKLGGMVIADPAAGCGNLLLAMVQRWRKLELELGLGPLPVTWKLGDVDAGALTIAAARLRRFRKNPGDRIEVIGGDALLEPAVGQFAGCDLLLGNPPFVPMLQLPEALRRTYRERYQFARGRFNLFALFTEAAMHWLAPDGVAALILPDRLIRNVQLRTLCRKLAETQTLLEFSELPERSFAAVVDCILVSWQNRLPQADAEFRRGKKTLPQKGFPENLLNRHAGDCPDSIPLGEIAVIRDGIIQGRVGPELFCSKAVNPHCRKLLVGRDVIPGKIHFAGRYVDYRPAHFARLEKARGGSGLRLRKPELFERAKILTRQTADRLIAAYDADGAYYYANTLHGIFLTAPGVDPVQLTRWLNSAEATRRYRALSAENGRAFAQIKLAILRRLPVPRRLLHSAMEQGKPAGPANDRKFKN